MTLREKKNFSRISLLFVITCVQGDDCVTSLSPEETFRKVTVDSEAKQISSVPKINRSYREVLFQRPGLESLLNGLYLQSLIFTSLFSWNIKV